MQVTHEAAGTRAAYREQRGRVRTIRDAIVAIGLLCALLALAAIAIVVAGVLVWKFAVAFAIALWGPPLGLLILLALVAAIRNEIRGEEK